MPDATPRNLPPDPSQPVRRPRRRWPIGLGMLLVVLLVLGAVWDWNWFRPLVEAQASARLGRSVRIGHFDLRPGAPLRIIAEDVTVANPDGFPPDASGGAPFVHAGRLEVALALRPLLAGHIVLPDIVLGEPHVEAVRLADGRANWTLATGGAGGAPPEIGDLRITDGQVHVRDPQLRSDFRLAIATRPAQQTAAASNRSDAAARAGREGSVLTVDAQGSYAGQPVTASLVGGALLSLRDAAHPWPIDLRASNGDTHISVVGTIRQPLAFAGADVTLDLAGKDMAALLPLTGIPVPPTPPYAIKGHLDYRAGRIRLDHVAGTLGSSDVEGDIAIDPGPARPVATMTLASRQVDLADFGGFIGTAPGRLDTPGRTAAQRREMQQAEASGKLLPQATISLPKLESVDLHLTYQGAHVLGRSVPLDNVQAVMDLVDGHLTLHPIAAGVGHGVISGNIDLTPAPPDMLRATAAIDFRQVDVARLMSATRAFGGAGTIGGHADFAGTGKSMATLLAAGNGEVKLFMKGGDLSALLVDLSGLEFGNALLSALGVPQRAPVQCMIVDLPLHDGVLDTRALLIATGEANITGSGRIDLRQETLDYTLRTVARHFTIGSLPAPIEIGGTLKNPSIRPGAELAARGGLAAGLGVLFPPLALLPTIQLGLGQDNACAQTLAEVNQPSTRANIAPGK